MVVDIARQAPKPAPAESGPKQSTYGHQDEPKQHKSFAEVVHAFSINGN